MTRTQTLTKIVMFTVPVWNIDLVTCVLVSFFGLRCCVRAIEAAETEPS